MSYRPGESRAFRFSPKLYSNPNLQAERSGHCRIAFSAHAVDFPWWHEMQGLEILYLSVISGLMKRKVWAWTSD
jgi:hypothetical protein